MLQTPNRIDEVRAFIKLHRILYQNLADALGVSRSRVYSILERDYIDKAYFQKLIDIGFPEHLLPRKIK